MVDLDTLARPATLCAFCPKMCRFSCAVAEASANEAFTPWAKMSAVYLGFQGQLDLGSDDSRRVLDACTGCGACAEQCAHGNPVADALFQARSASSENAAAKQRREAYERTGDVLGRDLAAAWARLERRRDATAAIAYFPGIARLCEGGERIERDLAALDMALGSTVPLVDVPAHMSGAGYALLANGDAALLAAHLKALQPLLAGHEIVVTADPEAAWLLKEGRKTVADLPAQGWPEVMPLVELLAGNAEAFAGASAGLKVRYHDPCYLGRKLDVYAAPRLLIEAATGQAPLEFANRKAQADCVGGAGLLEENHPEVASEMARRRVHEDGNSHIPVTAVVTACPSARAKLERAGVIALDIVDVALGWNEREESDER